MCFLWPPKHRIFSSRHERTGTIWHNEDERDQTSQRKSQEVKIHLEVIRKKKVNGCSDEVCMFSNFCILACLLQSWSHGLRTLHSRNSERILFATGPHWASRKIGAVSDGAEISMAPMHCTNEALCSRVTNASWGVDNLKGIWNMLMMLMFDFGIEQIDRGKEAKHFTSEIDLQINFGQLHTNSVGNVEEFIVQNILGCAARQPR